jgi:hypothetical protein
MSEQSLARLFSQPAFAGNLLRCAAFLEDELDILLTVYFIRSERTDAAQDLLLRELTFGRKIELLRKLPLGTSTSKKTALEALRTFQRLRNVAAHHSLIFVEKTRELLKDQGVRALFANYPTSFEKAFHAGRRSLVRLRKTKAFGPNARTESEKLEVRDTVRVVEGLMAEKEGQI